MDVMWSLWQATWGGVQTLAGLVVFCGCRLRDPELKWFWYRGTVVVFWHREDGLSLGLFLFVKRRKEEWGRDKKHMLSNETRRMIGHELGHCRQSAVLGPLYLIVIGLPSFLWCRLPKVVEMRQKKGVSYYDFYPERWAEAWGSKAAEVDL